jgi:hypothetical protein
MSALSFPVPSTVAKEKRLLKTREHLVHLLSEASEIEHNLLCSYIYAAVSLKKDREGLSAREAEVVARWRKQIMGVAIEEMGHLALVNNLLISIGGTARFDRPNFPVAPGYHPASIVVRLTPFSAATLQHFIYLERPDDADVADCSEFLPSEDYVRSTAGFGITPSTPDYETIGEFYADIRTGFCDLAAELGDGLFLQPAGAGQIGPDLVSLPGLIVITDLETALQAIDTIVEQGEGARHGTETCHFARFRAIREEWAELNSTNPQFAPAHPAASDPVMRKPVVEAADRVWITDPRAAQVLDLANATYGLMLSLLGQAYAPSAHGGVRKAYIDAALTIMRAVVSMAEDLARLPAGPEHPGINAGMTFAVPRNLRPRDPAVARAVHQERLLQLQQHAAGLLKGNDQAFEAARGALQTVR